MRLTKPYRGFLMKSWADRTWSSQVPQFPIHLLAKQHGSAQVIHQVLGTRWGLTPATDAGCTDKEQCTAQFTAHEPRRLDNITTNVTLEQTSHNTGEFKILLSTPNTSCRTKTHDFRRVSCNILRAKLCEVPRAESMRRSFSVYKLAENYIWLEVDS